MNMLVLLSKRLMMLMNTRMSDVNNDENDDGVYDDGINTNICNTNLKLFLCHFERLAFDILSLRAL